MSTVSFEVGRADVFELGMHHYTTSKAPLKKLRIVQVLYALVFAVPGVILTGMARDLRFLGIGLLVIYTFLALRAPVTYRKTAREIVRRTVEEPAYAKAFGKYTLTLTERGLTISSRLGNFDYSWKDVSSVALTGEYLFIFLAGAEGFPIRRDETNESTIQEINSFVESHIGPRGQMP